MEAQKSQLWIFGPVGGHLAPLPEADEVIGAVPGLDHVQAVLDFSPSRLVLEIAAEQDRLDRLAQFDDRAVGRVLEVMAHQAFEHRWCRRWAQP